MKACIFAVVFLSLSWGNRCGAQTIPDEMAILKTRFQKQVDSEDSALKKLNASYVGALKRLSETEANSGDLERVLEVKKEIETFGDGSDFQKGVFERRQSQNRGLRKLQETYLRSREKIDAVRIGAHSKLIGIYVDELTALEEKMTKEQRIDEAILVKTEREKYSTLSSVATSKEQSFKARAHFVAKGELEIYLNGREIRFRDSAKDERYVDVESPPFDVAVGDVIVLRQRGDAVFRGVIFGIAATDGSRHIEFPALVFRLIGTGDDLKPENVDAELISKKADALVTSSSFDGDMAAFWRGHGIKNCQFIQPPEKGVWATFGAVITKNMVVEKPGR